MERKSDKWNGTKLVPKRAVVLRWVVLELTIPSIGVILIGPRHVFPCLVSRDCRVLACYEQIQSVYQTHQL